MADTVFQSEPAGSAPKRAKKPVLALRGRRRKHVKRLADLLRTIRNEDIKEAARGQAMGYVPYLFRQGAGTAIAAAMTTLTQRCGVALSDKI